jgi:hypothetical protein
VVYIRPLFLRCGVRRVAVATFDGGGGGGGGGGGNAGSNGGVTGMRSELVADWRARGRCVDERVIAGAPCATRRGRGHRRVVVGKGIKVEVGSRKKRNEKRAQFSRFLKRLTGYERQALNILFSRNSIPHDPQNI